MPWHLSKSDPRKVYDERHEVVCICATEEQAARIVSAITGRPQSLRLREPATPFTHSFAEDPCCGSLIQKAARAGVLDAAQSWVCPACGEEWKSEDLGPVRHWRPHPAIMILR